MDNNLSTPTDEYDHAPPNAGALIESLRAFGYDLQTAIADIIDNSISANAKNIWIDFNWNGDKTTISIKDDGRGMTKSELIEAMRPGNISPSIIRDSKDLGRFGLGLKTASFSQCRRLTVATKSKDSNVAIRCWDIDYVIKTNDWRLLKINTNMDHFLLLTDMDYGTIVLWENIDVHCKNTNVNDQKSQRMFLSRIDIVKKHLAMTFHRYLERQRLKIWINNIAVEPWDPFLIGEKATQLLSEESRDIFGSRIVVKPYVLPHHTKISSETYQYAEGPRGWTAQQGFYVYRNERLIVAGSWLGLGFRKMDHYQLARIQIDIPNSMDYEWELDVKKSVARPPDYLREDLKRIARLTIERAMDIYRHRGKIIQRASPSEFIFLWEKRVQHGKIFYSINRNHPLIISLLTEPTESSPRLNALLKLLEETVPVNLIIIDNAESPDKHGRPFEKTPSNELKEIALEVYNAMIKSGLSPQDAKNKLLTMEPFDNYSKFIEKMLNLN